VTGTATIGIVDYGMGNRRSVEKAFEHVGAAVGLTEDPRRLRHADALVIPGVGAFPQGMENLRRRGLDELILERVAAGVPVLGICLGMQLLFDTSDEVEPARGLGLIPGHVGALMAEGRRIPHIGWNLLRFERPSPLTATLPSGGAAFYHVHSFTAHPEDPADIVATAEYGERFATIVQRGNVFGVQFHPEKSSRDGLTMLAAFAALAVRETAAA
jgi:glutamine amidotransferase